jgi:hypothetical protein
MVILTAYAQQNCDDDDDVPPPKPLLSTCCTIMRKTLATGSVCQHGDLQHNLTSENTADPLMNRFKK